jgi:uncharacterized pyridoxal phosphate-dependent enzyme
MSKETGIGRRGFLQTALATAGAAAGASIVGPATANAAPSPDVTQSSRKPDVYERLGVRPLINAAGILTMLGGSLISDEVKQAMEQASRSYVNITELQQAAGARIATVIGVESALVTSGAAAALLVATAACVTKGDPDRVKRIPNLTGMPNEVIVQRTHRHPFDHAIRNVGVRMIEVETRAELEKAINPGTAMMHFLVYADKKGKIGMREWIDVGKKHGIPNLLDAAADIPPAGNLRKYTDLGFDMVAFSGGKALRGPQCSGLLLGRKELVQAAFQNDSPFSDSIGRGCKVGKEEIVGLVTAVESYIKRDHRAEMERWQAIISYWEDELRRVPNLGVARTGPENAGNVPYLRLSWDDKVHGARSADLIKRLRDGSPRIELWSTDHGLYITPFMLRTGEESVVIQGIVSALGK